MLGNPIHDLSSSLPALSGLLSTAGFLNAPAGPGVAPAAQKPAPPAVQEPSPSKDATAPGAAPEAGAFPAVLETFAYRFQLDLEFEFSFSGQTAPARPAARPDPASIPPPPAPFSPPGFHPATEAGRRIAFNALREIRAFQSRAFLQQSRRFSRRLAAPTATRMRSSSRQVARRFELNFSLNLSFLHQFARQSGTAVEFGEASLSHYLDISHTLTLRSAKETQAFFNHLDELLAGAEKQFKEEIPAFLAETASQFGLSDSAVKALDGLLEEQIGNFFSTASTFLDQAEGQIVDLLAPAAEGDPTAAPPAPELLPA